jgi:hypothetical protein
MESNFLIYNDDISLICNHTIHDFEFNVNRTIVQIEDCAVVNAVNFIPCDIWKKGTVCADFANIPDKNMLEHVREKGAELTTLENSTPIDIYNTIYYSL